MKAGIACFNLRYLKPFICILVFCLEALEFCPYIGITRTIALPVGSWKLEVGSWKLSKNILDASKTFLYQMCLKHLAKEKRKQRKYEVEEEKKLKLIFHYSKSP